MKYGGKGRGGADEDESEKDIRAELTKLEIELCKQNFQFYDKIRQGYVERFELPLILKSNQLPTDDSSLWILHYRRKDQASG